MSSPLPRHGAMRVLVAEDHVVLAARIAEGLGDAGWPPTSRSSLSVR
jgi:hypothetical protein